MKRSREEQMKFSSYFYLYPDGSYLHESPWVVMVIT